MVAAAFDRMTARARREIGRWLTIATKDKEHRPRYESRRDDTVEALVKRQAGAAGGRAGA